MQLEVDGCKLPPKSIHPTLDNLLPHFLPPRLLGHSSVFGDVAECLFYCGVRARSVRLGSFLDIQISRITANKHQAVLETSMLRVQIRGFGCAGPEARHLHTKLVDLSCVHVLQYRMPTIVIIP